MVMAIKQEHVLIPEIFNFCKKNSKVKQYNESLRKIYTDEISELYGLTLRNRTNLITKLLTELRGYCIKPEVQGAKFLIDFSLSTSHTRKKNRSQVNTQRIQYDIIMHN